MSAFVLLAFAACSWETPETWGEAERVRYTTDLGWVAEIWWPGYPVAAGTTFTVTTRAWTDSSGYVHDYGPNGELTSSDPSVLEIVAGDGNGAQVAARAPGVASLAWTGGDAEDHIEVEVADATAFAVYDPAVAGFLLLETTFGATPLAGELPPPTGGAIVVADDEPVELWVDVVDAGGRRLGIVDADLAVDTGTGLGSYEGERLAIAAGSDTGVVPLTWRGAALSEVSVDRVPGEDIAAVSLVVADAGEVREHFAVDVALLVVAWDAAGRRVLQPHVAWAIPEGFVESSLEEALPTFGYSTRRDLLVLDWVGESDTLPFTFGARVGSLNAEATVTVGVEGPEPLPEPDPTDDEDDGDGASGSACCCGGPGGAMLVLLAVMGARRRGRGR